MRFLITLNIYSNKSTKPLHQMTIEHPAESLEDFVSAIAGQDFIVGNVVYVDDVTNELSVKGQIAINYNSISKIVPLKDRV